MNIKTRPLIISTAAAAILIILFTAANTLIGFAMLPTDFSEFMDGPDSAPIRFIQFASLVSCLVTLLTGAIYIGAGILYAFLHNRETRVAAESGALGGAASAALGSIAGALASGILSIFVTPLVAERMMQGLLSSQAGGIPLDQIMPFMGLSTIFGVVGTVVGACFGAVIAAALGAVGGALTSAILANRHSV